MGPPLPGLSTAPRGLALCGPHEIVAGSVGAPAKGWQWVTCEAVGENWGAPFFYKRIHNFSVDFLLKWDPNRSV